MSHKLIPLVTMSVLLLASPLLAQSSRGSVRGRVTDQAGAPLAPASVRAARSDTGESRTVTTDEAGRFSLAELEVGEYRFDVTTDRLRDVYASSAAGSRTGPVARRPTGR